MTGTKGCLPESAKVGMQNSCQIKLYNMGQSVLCTSQSPKVNRTIRCIRDIPDFLPARPPNNLCNLWPEGDRSKCEGTRSRAASHVFQFIFRLLDLGDSEGRSQDKRGGTHGNPRLTRKFHAGAPTARVVRRDRRGSETHYREVLKSQRKPIKPPRSLPICSPRLLGIHRINPGQAFTLAITFVILGWASWESVALKRDYDTPVQNPFFHPGHQGTKWQA